MQKSLDELSAADLLRREAVVESPCGAEMIVGGRPVVCLCSNDYLGLAADPAIRRAVVDAIGRWGVGSGASRLVSGTTSLHVELERRLAEFKHCEKAILTSTGWMANRVAIHALAGSGDLVLTDKLNHASIIDAGRSCGARMRTFPHRDVARLEKILEKYRDDYRRCLIVTDSLFSMDGDFAPLRRIVELKNRYNAQLLIDEAHATGVIGPGGRGVAAAMGIENQIGATVGTLSKAVGALGGFVAGPAVLIDTIRNTGRAYIYTTAPPAMLCAAALAALDIIRDQPQRRERLMKMAGELQSRLKSEGMETGDSESQIFPVIIGQAGRAMEISAGLLEKGFFVPAIRPPTVPKGTSRLRISLTASHDQRDLDRFAEALKKAFR